MIHTEAQHSQIQRGEPLGLSALQGRPGLVLQEVTFRCGGQPDLFVPWCQWQGQDKGTSEKVMPKARQAAYMVSGIVKIYTIQWSFKMKGILWLPTHAGLGKMSAAQSAKDNFGGAST